MVERDNQDALNTDLAIESAFGGARLPDWTQSFGLRVVVPDHGQDEYGSWLYGVRPSIDLASNTEIVADFASEMRSIMASNGESLVRAETLDEQEVEAFRIVRRESGAGAYSWPELVIEFFERAQPFLSNGADLLAWGYFLKQVVSQITHWAETTDRGLRDASGETLGFNDFKPRPFLTRPSLVALCYVNLVEQYGVAGDVSIDVFPRSRLPGPPDSHMAQAETNLIRLRLGDQTFFYLVDNFGTVLEHFVATGDGLSLLSLPELVPRDPYQLPYRYPQPVQHFTVSIGVHNLKT